MNNNNNIIKNLLIVKDEDNYIDYPVQDVDDDGYPIEYTMKVFKGINESSQEVYRMMKEEEERRDNFLQACRENDVELLKTTLTRDENQHTFPILCEMFSNQHIEQGFIDCCRWGHLKCGRYIINICNLEFDDFMLNPLNHCKDTHMREWLQTLSNKEE